MSLFKTMESSIELLIPYRGIGMELKTFHWRIEKPFFDKFENSPISVADIDVVAELDKNARLGRLKISLEGTIEVECDRCMETFDLIIDGEFQALVRESQIQSHREDMRKDDDIIVLPPSGILDLSSQVHDYSVLSIPLRIVHPVDAAGKSLCNEEVLKFLS